MTETKIQEQKPQRKNLIKVTPAVDIRKNQEDGVILTLDLPGVAQENIDIQVNKNLLTVQAEMQINLPENFTFLGDEFPGELYEQSFNLNAEVDTENIKASFNEGVLTLALPKREELKPKKIKINVA